MRVADVTFASQDVTALAVMLSTAVICGAIAMAVSVLLDQWKGRW